MMNPDTNKFEAFKNEFPVLLRADGTEVPKHWAVFRLDEDVVIKGYTFRVKYIGESSILFEPIGPQIIDEK